jgi:hypothetical protein
MNRKQRRFQQREQHKDTKFTWGKTIRTELKVSDDSLPDEVLAALFIGAWTKELADITLAEKQAGKSDAEMLVTSDISTEKAIAYARSLFTTKQLADRAELAFIQVLEKQGLPSYDGSENR